MKTDWNCCGISIADSGHWSELAFGFWLCVQLDKHIVSTDTTWKGRWIGGGINFLRWRISASTMFSKEPTCHERP